MLPPKAAGADGPRRPSGAYCWLDGGVSEDVVVESLFTASRGVTPLTRPELFALEPLYLRGSSAEEAAKKKPPEGGPP